MTDTPPFDHADTTWQCTDPDCDHRVNAALAIEREAAAPAATHTHDLRIGAREYEDGSVRAWQVYCVICDEAGRIVLPEPTGFYDNPDAPGNDR